MTVQATQSPTTAPRYATIVTMVKHFTLRDLGHYLATALATFALECATGLPTTKAGWIAAFAGVAPVLFRQVFPNVNVSPAELNASITWLEQLTEKIHMQNKGPCATPPAVK
jgi:hypothetical protein